MRILHITSHLNVGGITSYVISVSRVLAERNHRVVIASGGGQLVDKISAQQPTGSSAAHGALSAHWNVPLNTSAEFSLKVYVALRRLFLRLRHDPVDIIHAHTRVAQVVADRLSQRLSIPYATTWHGFYTQNLGRRLLPCTGEATIAISEPVRRHLIEVFGVPDSRVYLVPNGIDPRPFERPVDPGEKENLRNMVGLKSAPVIGTVARLVNDKGIDQLIRCLARVRSSVPNAQLLIVGDGPERGRLEALAHSIGKGAVLFAGALAQTSIALSLMDVFVFLPARKEGFGLSLLEAMASARPVVALRRGSGAAWVLEKSNVGVLVEPNDDEALARAIADQLQNGKSAMQNGENGRRLVRERYNLCRVVDTLETIYAELVARHSRLVT